MSKLETMIQKVVQPKKRATRQVFVAGKCAVSPNMQRIILEGAGLADFPGGYEGGYVKLVLPSEGEKPAVRSYTVRLFDPVSRRLTIDMVVHGDLGPAASWVSQVAIGDSIEITGPGACQPISTDADWFILAGDMSALPAISVNIERLPPDAVGHVVLEVISFEDQIELATPPGIEVHWVVNPEPEAINTELEDTVMDLPWRDGRVSVWVAGEFSASRTLRQYFRNDRPVEKGSKYISCYWKIGETDEGMKAAKRADAEGW